MGEGGRYYYVVETGVLFYSLIIYMDKIFFSCRFGKSGV